MRTETVASGTGFSLIELMVTVAIIGILAAIAYPSYTQHLTRTNRVAAQNVLLQMANKQEQYLLDNREYTSTVSELVTVPADVSRHYTIAIEDVSPTTNTYTMTATPIDNQATRDTLCGKLSLMHDGTKGETGTGSISDCW